MRSKKEIDETRMAEGWGRYERSAAGQESAELTRAQMCLSGTASDEQYDSLEQCYATYDGDFTYVGPGFGPYKITGKNALLAWNRVNGLEPPNPKDKPVYEAWLRANGLAANFFRRTK
ncbi:MAG: hypothetical protein ACYTEQ_11440 [Planctomycetota bacterium]|jgi:hypothetical protein